jgi:hypothetical protein
MNRSVLVGLTIALICLLVACTSTLLFGRPSENTAIAPSSPQRTIAVDSALKAEPEIEADSPPADLVEDLKSVVSSKTGVPSHEVLFVSSEPVEWSDACLGVPSSDEFCAQVITSGYRITLTTLMEEYVFHTDRAGREFRLAQEPDK